MTRRWIAAAIAAACVVALSAPMRPARAAESSAYDVVTADEGGSTRPTPEQWHRLNPDRSNPAPEHERLRCHVADDHPTALGPPAAMWACMYDKLPEPELALSWNRTRGRFAGTDVTSTWTCPSWLPSNFCPRVMRVVEGVFSYTPEVGEPFIAREDLVLVRSAPTDKLVVIWIDAGFACRWFPTFDDALAANPFPLPFDGVHWPSNDCLFAPH